MQKRIVSAWIWTGVVIVACWIPGRWLRENDARSRLEFSQHDKVVHGFLFAGFGYLWMRALATRGRTVRIVALGLTLAVVTELGQAAPIVDRDPDPFDALADAGGLVLGIFAGISSTGSLETRPRDPGADVGDPISRGPDQ